MLLIYNFSLAADDSPQQFEGFNLAGTDAGVKKWDIKGDHADIIGDIVNLTNIVANAYGEEQTNLTAKTGTLNKATGKMHLEKDVVVTTESGEKLTTDTLDWERDKDLVKTDDKVVLTKEGMTATGTGAIGHPGLKTAQMNQDITVQIDTKSPDPLSSIVTITCDGPLEIDYNNQKATFNNNVVAIQNDRKLTADKMEALFDSQTKQIKEMICTGHVTMRQGENTTYSEKAVYNAEEQRLVLSGSPKLIFYTDNMNVLPNQKKSPEEGESLRK